jgi:hypothetical protein
MSAAPQQPRASNLALAAFIFGLASIPLAFFPWGMFPGPVAIVLGLVAQRRQGDAAGRPRFARGGAILGAGGVMIWVTIYGLLALLAS